VRGMSDDRQFLSVNKKFLIGVVIDCNMLCQSWCCCVSYGVVVLVVVLLCQSWCCHVGHGIVVLVVELLCWLWSCCVGCGVVVLVAVLLCWLQCCCVGCRVVAVSSLLLHRHYIIAVLLLSHRYCVIVIVIVVSQCCCVYGCYDMDCLIGTDYDTASVRKCPRTYLGITICLPFIFSRFQRFQTPVQYRRVQ